MEREKNGLYCATENLRATRDKFHGRRSPMIERGYISNVVSEKETFQKIRKHMNSAASSLYELTSSLSNKASLDPKNLGVIGFVATLGKVDDGNISRLLSEFLGKNIMMAVVCDTIKSAKDLEYRVSEGLINTNMETHKVGEAIGQTTNEQFPVICLERLSPYVGGFIADDPQRRLDLPKPRLPGGGVPRGFLGFAVNMIFIDVTKQFSFTPRVNGLRETLFYSLFSKMQVYRSEEDMQHALPYMTDGAISLDGGIIGVKDKNIVSYKGDPDIVFPKYSGLSCPPMDYLLLEAQIKDKEMQQEVLLEELQSVNEFLEILIKVESRLVSRENTIQ